MLLNNEPCLAKATLIDLNPNELNFVPLMNNLDKCSESCYLMIYLMDHVFQIKQRCEYRSIYYDSRSKKIKINGKTKFV